jgi:hypothetical protein
VCALSFRAGVWYKSDTNPHGFYAWTKVYQVRTKLKLKQVTGAHFKLMLKKIFMKKKTPTQPSNSTPSNNQIYKTGLIIYQINYNKTI